MLFMTDYIQSKLLRCFALTGSSCIVGLWGPHCFYMYRLDPSEVWVLTDFNVGTVFFVLTYKYTPCIVGPCYVRNQVTNPSDTSCLSICFPCLHFENESVESLPCWVLFCSENAGNKYGEVSDIIGTSHPGDTERGEITRDLSTSFVVLLAIYFPSITGETLVSHLVAVLSCVCACVHLSVLCMCFLM